MSDKQHVDGDDYTWPTTLGMMEQDPKALNRHAIPVDEIRNLATSVDELTFGQNRSARIVLDWLAAQPKPKV